MNPEYEEEELHFNEMPMPAIKIDRWSLFSNEEKQALLRSLEEFVPVYAHGKLWNEVAVASMHLLSELRQEELAPHPHL